jgi:predicted extracellular nuclease
MVFMLPNLYSFRRSIVISLALFAGILSLALALAQEITPITAIQSQLANDDNSAFAGRIVTVEGIVTGVYGDLFFIQEVNGGAWSGIAVYRPGHDVVTRDSVRINGKVSEYYDLTQITPTTIEVLSRNSSLPQPVPLTLKASASEKWEGVLVEVENLIVITAPNQYGEWRAGDESGEMLVDDRGVFYAAQPGQTISKITAIVDHAFGSYRLIPRSLEDIQAATAETLPDDLTPIYRIQGAESTTALAGERVNAVGVVTGIGAEGFFLQDALGDENPLTSDGIYVYTARRPQINVGQCILVRRGEVSEFYGKTELSRAQAIQPVDLCPNQPVAPVTIPAPLINSDPAALLEPFEGMLVAIDHLTGIVQGPTKRFRDGSVEIAIVPKPFVPYLPGGRVFQAASGNVSSLIFLTNLIGVDLPAAAWGDSIRVEAAVEDEPVLAILDYNFGKYQLALLPGQAVTVSSNGAVRDRVEKAAADEFTVCIFNLYAMGRGSDQYPDPADYAIQLRKRAALIAEPLQGCTILGLQEAGTPEDVENLAALLTSEFGLDYQAAAVSGPNSKSAEFPLTLGLLARADQVEIVHVEAVQACSPKNYDVPEEANICPTGEYALFNRPPLVVDLLVQGEWDDAYGLTVIVNHWKSKTGDESMNVVRRTRQAEHVTGLVQARLDEDPGAHVVVLGDLNDYYQSGPVETLRQGTTPRMIHPYDMMPPLDRYTYIFNGASQVLDHILFTAGMRTAFAGIDPLHINADFPMLDGMEPETLNHTSDHDPVQLTIRPAGAGWIGGRVGLPGVIVSLRNEDGSGVGLTLTDQGGEFRFWGLAPGRYRIDFKAPAGLTIQTPESLLQVKAGAGLYLQPPLQLAQSELGIGAILLSAGLGTVETDRSSRSE